MLWYYTKAVREGSAQECGFRGVGPRFRTERGEKGVDKKKAARYNKRHGEMPNGP